MIYYITYRLLSIAGEGHQPHHQCVSMGWKFEGGQMGKDGRMFAHVEGDKDINELMTCLSAWGAKLLTQEEALKWFDDVIPAGTKVSMPPLDSRAKIVTEQIVAAAVVGKDGRIEKGYEDVKA
jgi:hypothetical protein